MEDNSSSVTNQAIKILEYWHKVEFFESTDIKDLEDNADGVLTFELDDLQSLTSLPWIDPQQIQRAGTDYSPCKKYNYELFFGIFERREIFTRTKRIFPDTEDINAENLRDEGRTCSVKCIVDQDGVIDKESFEFSTVTWALGQLEAGNLDNLRFNTYESATKSLQQRFIEIITRANNLKKQHDHPAILTTYEIIEFLKSMAEWTCFSPENPTPALFIKLKETKPNKKSENLNHHIANPILANLTQLSDILISSEPQQSPSLEKPTASDISILNSFYIRDIEKVLHHIKNNNFHLAYPLARYLAGCCFKKEDLLLPQGRELLREKLRLSQLPAGRWPSDPQHNMSLMQQFAINTSEKELELSGIYSVNGPPGTGKTTMLRDIIANNLVKRASVLAGLKEALEAFDGYIVEDVAGKTRSIPRLSSRLCGYEMVVTSSNNAAVENISRELPQIKSLGKKWQDIDYLKAVAQKLAAKTQRIENKDGKTYKIYPLTAEEDCWGLIAAALGKQENRDTFGDRVFFKKTEDAVTPSPANTYLNLYAAIKQVPQKSFSDAQNLFRKAQDKYNSIKSELMVLERLNDQFITCEKIRLKVEKLQLRQLQLRVFLAKRRIRIPGWWTLKIKAILKEKNIYSGLHRRLKVVQAKYEREKNIYHQASIEFNLEQKRHEDLQERYNDVLFPSLDIDINTQNIQRTSFGNCHALNEARSILTIKALELHQAWLVTIYKEKKLTDALLSLMSAINGGLKNEQSNKALLRLLFMIVPVVSSTFASFSRQFNSFSAGDIGWLFIDEAGQATPQQAVGALWRAKRAVVVGDPLQIEPVFTIPPAFVEAIAKREFTESWREWSPTVQSVQTLADRVNPFGTQQISKSVWLGSPLRVHRRCDEPMFSIANAIAYNNKMLHGRDQLWPQDLFLWGNSHWFDICGEADGKHYVPAQGQHVLVMMKTWLYHNNQTLPDAFIISPFKQVKNRIKDLLRYELREVDGINKWVNTRIGTVHTFQGKEEKNVILVLGLSEEKPGAAKWASSKPNLLNVAITRAQKRVYIIGSKEIWSGCQYFDVLDSKLAEVPLVSSLDSPQRSPDTPTLTSAGQQVN